MMWEEDVSTDRTGFGGGFDISGYNETNTPSRGTNKARGTSASSTICPVTISQILESTDEGVKINGKTITMLVVVGIVKSVDISSTRVFYRVEDWSGCITGIQWLEAENDQTHVVEDTYCKMIGTKKIQEGKTCFFIYKITNIENFMDVTHHYLEVTYINMKSGQLSEVEKEAGPTLRAHMVASFGDEPSDSNGMFTRLNLTPQQKIVYRILQECKNEEGLDNKSIQSMMKVKMSLNDINTVLEYLASEGHIYATKDDYHFKTTDLLD